jgi:Leucine-rich repeat (LRR) protein
MKRHRDEDELLPQSKRNRIEQDLMELSDEEDVAMIDNNQHMMMTRSFWKMLMECRDVWVVIISFLNTHSWFQLSYTCKYMNDLKYDQLVMVHKKKSIKRYIETNNGQIFQNCKDILFNIDLNSNSTLNDDCFRSFDHVISLTMFGWCHRTVTDSAFQYLPNLRILDISWSSKSSITDKAFSYVPNLQVLDISGCEQKLITDSVFAYLPNLNTLVMSRCSQITDGAFRYLTNLKSLDMSYCTQLTITDQAFKQLKNIQMLTIRGCLQRSISDEIFWFIRGTLKRLIAPQKFMRIAGVLNSQTQVTFV